MRQPAELAAADAYCRRLLAGHYENFWVSSPLVPADRRPHLARLYAFCRITDDLGDESGGSAEARLRLWQEDLERCFDTCTPPLNPVLLALAETIAGFALPAQPFRDLVMANLQDQRVKQYERWEQLLAYCRLSAAPVGRLVLRLFDLAEPRLDALSDDVCIGLQLANHAQDVAVDRMKGRSYLLRPEVEALGVEGALRSLCERAAELLRSGRELESEVPRRLGLQLALYRLGGEAILERVRRAGYRTDLRRPTLSNSVKLALLPRAWLQSTRRSRPGARYREA